MNYNSRRKYDSDSEDEDTDDRELQQTRNSERKRKLEQKKFQKSFNPIYVSGPNKAVKLVNSEKTIYLFGEWHGYEKTCDEGKNTYSIISFLASIFSANIPIDFYLEAPLVHLFPPERQKTYNEQLELAEKFLGRGKAGILVELRDAFKNCFHPSFRKRECEFGNVRMHYTDTRPFFSLENMAREIVWIKKEGDWNTFKEKYKEEIKELGEIQNCVEYTEYIMKKMKSNRELSKQLQKSGYKEQEMLNLIFSLCDHFLLSRYAIKYYNLLSSDVLPRDWLYRNPNGDSPDVEQDFSDILQSQLSILHDLYTFLRINKDYIKNVIFYGGLAHYEMLKYLFQKKGYTQEGEESSQFGGRVRCLELRFPITFGGEEGEEVIYRQKEESGKKHEIRELNFDEIDKEFDELSDDD